MSGLFLTNPVTRCKRVVIAVLLGFSIFIRVLADFLRRFTPHISAEPATFEETPPELAIFLPATFAIPPTNVNAAP
jgi:hypothetical protein